MEGGNNQQPGSEEATPGHPLIIRENTQQPGSEQATERKPPLSLRNLEERLLSLEKRFEDLDNRSRLREAEWRQHIGEMQRQQLRLLQMEASIWKLHTSLTRGDTRASIPPLKKRRDN